MPVHFMFEKQTGNIIHRYLKLAYINTELLIENKFEIRIGGFTLILPD